MSDKPTESCLIRTWWRVYWEDGAGKHVINIDFDNIKDAVKWCKKARSVYQNAGILRHEEYVTPEP